MKKTIHYPEWTKVPEETLRAVISEYQDKVQQSRAGIETAAGFFGVATVIVGILSIMSPILLLAALACATVSAAIQGGMKNGAAMALDEAHGKLRKEFRKAQEKAYADKQQSLLDRTETLLSQGSLFNEKTLSQLVCLDEKTLNKASDSLAITVYQARQLLHYNRIKSRKAFVVSLRSAPKPMTFKSENLDPSKPGDVKALRDKLVQNNAFLEEDVIDADYQPMSIAKPSWTESHLAESFLRVAIAPLFLMMDRQSQLNDHKLPTVLVAEIPALKAISGIGGHLAQYEVEQKEKLDLPAYKR